jgi:hypothetical protein
MTKIIELNAEEDISCFVAVKTVVFGQFSSIGLE